MNWQRLFKGYILDRGYDYFCEGAVENLDIEEDGICATVCGTEEYEVEICFDGSKVIDMYCSCPYALDGNNCKHMAAVLYEWETNDESVQVEKGEKSLIKTIVKEEIDEIEQLIKEADDRAVRDFLSYVLHNDMKLFSRFKTFIKPEISKSDMERYKRQVDATVSEYLGYENYISYYKAYDFISAMETFLDEDVQMMLDSGCYWNAFELTCYLFLEVGNVEMDNSDGGTTMFADQCMQIWEEILDYADEETTNTIYKWFKSHLNGSVNDYMEEYIESILMERFKDMNYLQDKLKYVDQKVSQAKQNPESWSSKYQITKWAICYIGLMEEMGFSQADIYKYCKENWKYSEIRDYYISKCMECKDYNEAVSALKESLELDAGMRGLVIRYRSKLKEIYKLMGRQEDYREQLWALVIRDDTGNLEYYRELKKIYSAEEWENIREEIFDAMPKHAHVDYLYKEEKLYDRLLEYVLAMPGLYTLQQYENVLKKEYPKEILQKYAEELNKVASHTADRKRYQEWMAILRRMSKIKGGKEIVREIAEHWRVVYRNRPAMMDELRKL